MLLYGPIGHSRSIIMSNASDKLRHVMHDNQTYICISDLDKSRVLFDEVIIGRNLKCAFLLDCALRLMST